MYDWHSAHPSEGKRFALAMKGVSQCTHPRTGLNTLAEAESSIALDPADQLFASWFDSLSWTDAGHVIEVGGRYGFASAKLVKQCPQFTFEVLGPAAIMKAGQTTLDSDSQGEITFTPQESYFAEDFTRSPLHVRAILVRNVLWNWPDQDAVHLLRSMIPLLQSSKRTSILVCDGVSPAKDAFPPSVEIAYRRRDVTMMTMHNVKQRTYDEWVNLFMDACPDFKVKKPLSCVQTPASLMGF